MAEAPATVPSTQTTPGGVPRGGTESASRQTLGQIDAELNQLKQDKQGLLNQVTALRTQQRDIATAAQNSPPAEWRVPTDPRTGKPVAGGQPVPFKPGTDERLDPATIVDRQDAKEQIDAIEAAVTDLLQQAAATQAKVYDAALKRDAVVRSVAVDEDPATLDAMTRAAEKERLDLEKDTATLAEAKAKAAYQAAYDAGFPAGNKAALDQAQQQAANANAQATATFNAAQAEGVATDTAIKAITLKYADALGAIGVTQAGAEAGRAVAQQSSAESQAIADAQAAAGGIGTWTAENQRRAAEAQAALAQKYGAETAQTTLTTEQTRQGEAVTRINQLREAIRKGSISKEAAGDLYFNAVYGGDQFQRSAQASKNALELQRDLIGAGMAVRPDQEFIVGGEPGGVYQQGMEQLGYSYTPVPVRPTNLPAWATAANVDINPRQGLPQGQPFTATGEFNPAFASPLAAPTAAAPAWATAPASQPAVIDSRGGAFRQRLAQPAA